MQLTDRQYTIIQLTDSQYTITQLIDTNQYTIAYYTEKVNARHIALLQLVYLEV